MRLGADISHEARYMPSRPARPGFWRSESNDPDGTFERGTGFASAQTFVPRLAPRHAGNGFDYGPLRLRCNRAIGSCLTPRLLTPDGSPGPHSFVMDHRRSRTAATLRYCAVSPESRAYDERR